MEDDHAKAATGIETNLHNEKKMVAVSTIKQTRPAITKRKRKLKPLDFPKRPLSAYNIFFKEKREKILDRKDSGQDDLTDVPMVKYVSNLWKTASSKEKTRVDEMAKAELQRYQREVKEYEERMGNGPPAASRKRKSKNAQSQTKQGALPPQELISERKPNSLKRIVKRTLKVTEGQTRKRQEIVKVLNAGPTTSPHAVASIERRRSDSAEAITEETSRLLETPRLPQERSRSGSNYTRTDDDRYQRSNSNDTNSPHPNLQWVQERLYKLLADERKAMELAQDLKREQSKMLQKFEALLPELCWDDRRHSMGLSPLQGIVGVESLAENGDTLLGMPNTMQPTLAASHKTNKDPLLGTRSRDNWPPHVPPDAPVASEQTLLASRITGQDPLLGTRDRYRAPKGANGARMEHKQALVPGNRALAQDPASHSRRDYAALAPYYMRQDGNEISTTPRGEQREFSTYSVYCPPSNFWFQQNGRSPIELDSTALPVNSRHTQPTEIDDRRIPLLSEPKAYQNSSPRPYTILRHPHATMEKIFPDADGSRCSNDQSGREEDPHGEQRPPWWI